MSRPKPVTLDVANAATAKYNLSGATARAVRLYLTGISPTGAHAARTAGLDPAAVSRALKRVLVTTVCTCCGNKIQVVNV